MKLIQLEPYWLTFEEKKKGFIFRCPCCITGAWITCFFQPTPKYRESGYHYNISPSSQCGMIHEVLSKENWKDAILCNEKTTWYKTNDTFEDLTISPSLNFPDHWHGHVFRGTIMGGVQNTQALTNFLNGNS